MSKPGLRRTVTRARSVTNASTSSISSSPVPVFSFTPYEVTKMWLW